MATIRITGERGAIAGSARNDLYLVDPAASGTVRVRDAGGTDRVRLAGGGAAEAESWVVDGRDLVYRSASGLVLRFEGGRGTVEAVERQFPSALTKTWLYAAGEEVSTRSAVLAGTDGADELFVPGYVDGRWGRYDIYGGGGDDVIRSSALCKQSFYGGAGEDRIQLSHNGPGFAAGGDGDDVLLMENGPGGGLATLAGGAGHDLLRGGRGGDRLEGGAGRDSLSGQAGDDALHGGGADDRLAGGPGSDSLFGGSGDDQLLGGDKDVVFDGGTGNDRLVADGGRQTLIGGEGEDSLHGGDGMDDLDGGDGNDLLVGGNGMDDLFGGDGNDRLVAGDGEAPPNVISFQDLDGGAGNDRLEGGRSDDVLSGGTGEDVMTGGGGADVFVLSIGDGRDVVMGFESNGTADFLRTEDTFWIGFDPATLSFEYVGEDTIVRYGEGDRMRVVDAHVNITDFWA